MRILIVEDQPLIALHLEHDLVGDGHEIVGIAATRQQALALAGDQAPDLAFVDVQLADGDTGIAIARQLASPQLKVVFLTGSAELLPEDGAGAIGVLGKPYAIGALRGTLALVEHLLGRGPPAPPPPQLRCFQG